MNAERPRLASLEAFRGLAALMVVLVHSPFYATRGPHALILNGPLMVDFFFVISGFVMTYAYGQRIGKTVTPREFFVLRLGRLYPLHVFMLLVWVPYVVLKAALVAQGVHGVDPTYRSNPFTFLTNLLLIHSLGIHRTLSFNFPSWSISVEFAAYAIYFGFAWTLSQGRLGDRAIALSAAAISIAAYAALLHFNAGGSIVKTFDHGILRGIGGFFAGASIHYAYRKWAGIETGRLLASLIEIGVLGGTLALLARSHESNALRLATFAGFVVTVLVFTIQRRGPLSWLLGLSPLQTLGRLSYSVYMIHAILCMVARSFYVQVLKLPTTTVLSANGGLPAQRGFVSAYGDLLNLALIALVIALSTVTYRHIEAPWRERFRRIARRRPPDSR